MIKRILSIALPCLLVAANAQAITLDELKGYSIQVTGTATGAFRSNDPRIPRSGEMNFDHRVYISQSGNFFTYGHNSAGAASEQGQFVSQMDQATSISRQRMGVWTIQNGNLTRITHQIEGFIVSTIMIDPAKTRCTATAMMQPDPVTHRVVRQWLHGMVTEMVSMTASNACTIRKGNIFAGDR
jgi:hypothetical protein